MKYSYQYQVSSGFITSEVFGDMSPEASSIPNGIEQIVLDSPLPGGLKTYSKPDNKISFLKPDQNGSLILDESKQPVQL